MDERESVLTNNQAAENLEQDFQFTNGVSENADNTTIKQYNRDILLQLRLHPLSLQKPKELPEMEVIKEKLYLTDITNMTSNSPEKSMDASTCYPYMKPDYRHVKSDLPLLPPYFSRLYPYCYSPYSYNGSYQSAPLKCRSSYNALCNPLKKHCMALHSCLRDLPLEECSWMKHFPPSDDMWHCYANSVPSGIYKRKEHLEAVPKSKKKLPVIDPVTGKDILETVIPSQPEQSSVKESSNSVENYMAAKEQCGDHLCSSKENQEAVEYKSVDTKYDSALFSSGDKTCFEQQKYSGVEFETNTSAESLKNKSEDSSNYSASTVDYSQDEKSRDLKDENVDPSEVKNNIFEFPKTSEKSHKYDISVYNKQVPQNSYNREINPYFDVHGACRAHPIKECHLCNKNISKQHDTMQESFKQLREKMKQEEQKLAILQSFLKYKKYQLEESARNLDEKRIEIANWEYNLYNTAKLLQEKEQWLENKNEILSNKIQQLIEKEKLLKEEDKISSDTLYSDAFKEVGVPEKKFSFHKNEAKWSGISKMKNPKIDENNQYSFVSYDPKPPKMFEGMQSNVEKCKSDAFSLDELEKNLVFMEKMHSANEVNDTNVNKIELASSTNTGQKSNVNAPYDPLGYSKGQRYLPDYLNNWLDKKDKSAL